MLRVFGSNSVREVIALFGFTKGEKEGEADMLGVNMRKEKIVYILLFFLSLFLMFFTFGVRFLSTLENNLLNYY